jgi:hypothetical protein
MSEPTITGRLANTRDRELADGPTFSTVAKLVDVRQRSIASIARSRTERRSLAPLTRPARRDQVRAGATKTILSPATIAIQIGM